MVTSSHTAGVAPHALAPAVPPWAVWLRRAAVAATLAGVALWVHLAQFTGAPLWDSAVFLAGGRLMQRGLLLYRDLWDNKPPGIYLYQAAVYAVLPVAVWSLRVTDYALYLAGAAALYALCRRVAAAPVALAAAAGWLFVAHHAAFNVAGFYTEEYVGICAAIAVALAARWAAGGGLWLPLASGVAAAAAILFKTPGVACVVPVLLLLAARRPLPAWAAFGVGAALPLGAVAIGFWRAGAWSDLLDSQLWHALASHRLAEVGDWRARLGELVRQTGVHLGPRPWLLVPALLGAAVACTAPTRLRLAALAWALGDLLMVGAQRFYHAHYFIQAFPALAWLGAIGAAAALQGRPGDGRWRSAWRLGLGLVVVALAWHDAAAVVRERAGVVARNWAALRAGPVAWRQAPGDTFEAGVGAWIAARTAPDERIFVHDTGSASAIYWTADRLPGSRYLAENVVTGARVAEQLAELQRTRPAYIVIAGGPGRRPIAPVVEADYVLVAAQQAHYAVELWGRTRAQPLALGRWEGAQWTSPVLEANDGDGAVVVACESTPPGAVETAVRSAPAAALAAAPWQPHAGGETAARDALQVRCTLAPGAALFAVRAGRLRFSADAPAAAGEPLRTA